MCTTVDIEGVPTIFDYGAGDIHVGGRECPKVTRLKAAHERLHSLYKPEKLDWSKVLREFVGAEIEESEKPSEKTYYLRLKDRDGKVRVIICLLEASSAERKTFHYGISIRSGLDPVDIKKGDAIAYSRAVRDLKGRDVRIAERDEVLENIWSLCFYDYKKFLRVTGGEVGDFEKAGQEWCWETLKDWRNYVCAR
jgi:hypothetical protein